MRHPQLDDLKLPLSDLFTFWPQTIQVFIRYRMLCVGCQIARFHTIADACPEYNLDEARFVSELMVAADAS